MMTTSRFAGIAGLAALAMTLAMGAAAAPRSDAPPASAACEAGALKLATGPENKGYDKLGQNIKAVGGNVCLVRSEGGLDNLGLLSTKKADVAIVPIDAMKTMASGDENVANLQVVATLNSNYLHVATLTNGFTVKGEKKWGVFAGDDKNVLVTKFSQLRGVPVALVGSAQLLMRQLDKTLGFQMQFIDATSDAEAVKMLKAGRVYAMASVAGWPHGFFDKVTSNDGITLVPFDVTVSSPYTVRPLNYKSMGIYNVNSLGVQNVLVSRSFGGDRKNAVAELQNVIARNLQELKDGDFEPAWNEIKSLDTKVDWPNVFAAPSATTQPAPNKRK